MRMAGKLEYWWDGLDGDQRAAVIDLRGPAPAWVVETLQCAGVLTVGAQLDGQSETSYLLPTSVRTFLDERIARCDR